MDILSRRQAADLGHAQFFTGKSCKHGHVSPRYTSTGGCIACLRQYSSKFVGLRPAGSVAFPVQQVHPDDLDTLYAMVDYLNSKRGFPPAVRAGAQEVAPTAWESYLEKEMRRPPTMRPSLASIRHAASRLGITETYAATQGAPVDDWSTPLEQIARERDARLGMFSADLDRDGYAPDER